MQYLKYTNPKGERVEFRHDTPPYIFESVTGTDGVNAEIATSSSPGQNGKSTHQVTLSDREVTVKFNVKGKDRADMYKKRRELIAVTSSSFFSNGEPSGVLEYKNDLGTWDIPCIVKSGAKFDKRIKDYNHGTISFYCPDPYWRKRVPEYNQIAFFDSGVEFPLVIDMYKKLEFARRSFERSVFNTGDSPTPVEITIKGPAIEPEIIKVSTGEYIRVSRALNKGDTLVINTDMNNFTVIITRENGDKETAYGYLDLSSTPFSLAPGANELRFESGDDTAESTAFALFFPRFGGV